MKKRLDTLYSFSRNKIKSAFTLNLPTTLQLACLSLLAPVSMVAGTRSVDIGANYNDQEIRETGSTQWVGQTDLRVGGTNSTMACAVLPFSLPTLNSGESITGATLSVNLKNINITPSGNVDLYALDYRTSSAVNATGDFYKGTYGGDSSATAIDQAFATPSTSTGNLTTDASAEANLVAFLNDQYDAGASGGNFVFLRLSPSQTELNSYFWLFDSSTSSTSALRPKLTLVITEAAGDTQAPTVPTGLVASNVTSSSVDLDWNASTDNVGVTEYNVYINGANPMTVTGTSTTVSSLSASTAYVFTVRAVDAAQNASAQSTGVNVTTASNTDTQAPTVPTNLVASNVTSSSVDLDWNASTDNVGVTGYNLYINGANPMAISGNSATVNNLSASTAYTFTVSALDAAQNESSQSTGVNVTTGSSGGSSNPEQRFNLHGYNDVPTFPLSTTLVWPSNVGGYDICLWNDDRFAALTITIDDNIQPDHSWWLGMANTYDLDLTWFVITSWVGTTSNGTWSQFQALADAGHSIQSHTVTHSASSTNAAYITEYEQSQSAINTNISGQWAGTLAYPDPTDMPINKDIAADYYIGARGVHGAPNKANQISYMNTSSISAHVNSNYVNPVLNGTSGIGWLNNSTYLRGWVCSHFHTVNRTSVASELSYVDSVRDQLWIGNFYDVIRFVQERDTASVNVTSTTSSQIRFELSDWMDDSIYTYPLTIKFRVANDWTNVSGTQNGQSIEVTNVTHQGNEYVLVKAVPDAGEVVLSKSGGSVDTEDPSVPTGLVASNITSNSVDLDWNASSDNVGVTGYKVYTNGSSPVSVNGTLATVSSLSAGTSYAFTVSAYDAAGNESAPSAGVNATTSSGGGGSGGTINEDFSASASNFAVIAGGTWSVSNGRYVLSNPVNASTNGLLGNISIHNTAVSGDYKVSATIRITGTTSDWDDSALIFGYQDASNYYYVSLNESNDSYTKGVFKVVNGTPTELADIGSAISSNTDYSIEVERVGSSIIVKLNGSQLPTITDGTFTGGKFGFGSKNDGGQFDNLVVEDLSASIPVTGVSLSPSTLNLNPSASASVTATVSPSTATVSSVTWSTSNSAVATVDSSGLVSAVGVGSATITVTTVDGAFTDTCAVSVTAVNSPVIDEDFSGGSASFNVISGGSWSVSNGRYLLSNPINSSSNGLLGNISVHSTSLSGDYTVSALVRITGTTSDWNDAALVFGYQDASNYYYASLNESNDSYTMGLFKVVSGSPTELADFGAISIASDTDYNLEVIHTSSSITVNLNASQLINISENTFSGGQVGFGTKNDGAQFDDLLAVGTAGTSQVAAPVFSPGSGTYTSAQSVTISSTTSGASIRYTTDGSTPTSSTGSLYSGAVSVSATSTLKAIAYSSGMSDSSVSSATFTISTSSSGLYPTHPNQIGLSGVGITRSNLTPASSNTITSAANGTVISNRRFSDVVTLDGANGVTFKNCWFEGGYWYSVTGNSSGGGSNITFEDCDFGSLGVGNFVNSAHLFLIGGTNYIRRCFFYNSDDGMKLSGGSINYIEDSWIQPVYLQAGKHSDSIQLDDGVKAKVYASRTTFENRSWTFGGVKAHSQEELTASSITTANIASWGNTVLQSKPCGAGTTGLCSAQQFSDCFFSFVDCLMTAGNYIMIADDQNGAFIDNTVVQGTGDTDQGVRYASHMSIGGNTLTTGATYNGSTGQAGTKTNPTPIPDLGL